VDPQILADDTPFPEPTTLILIPDHYIFRMLYARGIPLEALGIPSIDGTEVETDARKIWQLFGEQYYLFAGTPTGTWLDHELYDVFGIRIRLNGETALRIYDEINEKLQLPEFRPRALFERFNIELLTTTDAATDTLQHHQKLIDDGWGDRIRPCFRPDALFRIERADWRNQIDALGTLYGKQIDDYATFIKAIESRRAYFKSMGAFATDHGVLVPKTRRLKRKKVEKLFQKALDGKASARDSERFQAHMLMEMAHMSVEDRLVMQIHPGSYRDHNASIFSRFGTDKGCDIPISTEFTRNLHPLLNAYGNDPRFRLVLFTLDETTYARELAPLAGHYPTLRLGPAWWFGDSIEGMTRYRQYTTETAGFYNTAGFNDDTRAFCSIPARHDLSRRVDANFLAGLVARHIIDMNEALTIARALAYDLVKETYRIK
jgi:glucuronate isomerase